MADRLELQSKFEELLGSRNVYFQPPSSISMKYDAIRYKLSGKDLKRANNRIYGSINRYDGVIITKNPDSTLPDRLLDSFEMVSFGSPYTADNLNHFPFTIYY
jgi:hypothetical protein